MRHNESSAQRYGASAVTIRQVGLSLESYDTMHSLHVKILVWRSLVHVALEDLSGDRVELGADVGQADSSSAALSSKKR